MRKCFFFVLISLVVLGVIGSLSAQSLVPSPTGSWTATGSMSQARTGAAAAAINNGTVLVTGGTDDKGNVLATAELYGSAGSFRTVAPLKVPRTGHTATWVPSPNGTPAGYVLVTGGTTTGGVIVGSVEMYDPNQNVWTLLPTPMVDARAGHPATLLPNSAVLLSGGWNSAGPVGSAEQFSFTSQQFMFVSLPSARKNHAAAALADGRVLLVGGTDASGTLNTTEIYDPASNSLTPGPNLATPRANATATTLLDGTVLIAGGSYPEGAAANGNIAELQSAEIYDPLANTIVPTARMAQARAGHQAFLLPNNNTVLLVGGVNNGTDLASAEVYTPWLGKFATTGTMAFARSDASGAALFPMADGQLLVAGGSNQKSSELYGFATIKTDQPDYAPGTPVIMTGTGWKPGETVDLYMQVIPSTAFVTPLQTTAADGGGNIMYGMWAPDQTDLGARFYLTAVGQTSGVQAQNTFTDGTLTVTVTGTGSVTGSVALSKVPCTSANSPCTASMSNGAAQTLTATGGTPVWTLANVAGTCSAGATTCSFSMNGNSAGTVTVAFTTTPTLSSISPTSATYGDAATTLTATGTSFANGSTVINFKGTDLTTTCSSSTSCSATIPATSLKTAVGALTVYVHNASLNSGDQSFTLNKKPITVTAVTNSKTYDGTLSALAVPTNSGVVSGDTANFSEAYLDKNVGTNNKTLVASGTVNDGNSGLNYSYTFLNISTGTISARAITVTAANNTKTYDGTTSATATPTVTSGTLATGETGSFTEAYSDKNAGTSNKTLVPSGAVSDGNSGNNYSYTFANFTTGTINKAGITVTASSSTTTYGSAVPTVTPTYSGFVNNETESAFSNAATCSTTYTTTSAVGSSPATSCSGAVATNYSFSYTNGSVTVNAATVTVTASSPTVQYGDAVPAITASFSGFVNGQDSSVLTIQPRCTTAYTTTSNAGSSPVTSCSGAVAANYTFGYTNGSVTVNKATPIITWATPSAITYGTALSGAQLNASSGGVAGTPTYTPAAGMVLNAGSQTLSVNFVPTDTTNYNSASGSVTLTVNKATPTLAWATPSAITYGTALSGTQLNATSGGVAGSFTYTPAAGAVLNAGSQTLNVTFAPTNTTNYDGATGTVSLTVNKGTPTITWTTPSAITYGTALSGAQLNATSGGVAGTFAYTPAIGVVLGAGTQTLNVTFTSTDPNYNGTTGSVTLTVDKANASVTPATASKSYGMPDPAFTGTLNGFLAEDNVTATYSRNTGEDVAGGPYVISATLSATGALSNYHLTYNTAAFTISPATALVELSNLSQNYDGARKAVTVSTTPSPLNVNVLYSNDSYGPSSVPPTNPGSYAVVATSGNGNYVGQATGTLTINKLNPALSLALLTGMPEPSPYGTQVYFELTTATTPCPTGVVQFFVDGDQGTPVTLTGADCSKPVELQLANLLPGAHNVYATYSGDAIYTEGTSNTTPHQVNGDQTTVVLATSGLSSSYGQTLTFTATVTNVDQTNGTVVGSVQFFDNDFQLAQVPVSATPPYTASYSTWELGAGSHSIKAVFVDPSGTYLGSSSAISTESIAKTTPTVLWPNPADIVYGTQLSSTQLNAKAMDGDRVLDGTFVYTPNLNTVLAVGQRNLTVTFTPNDTANYNGNNGTATINVTAIPVTAVITANSKPYDGTNAATLGAVSLSGVLPADNGNVQLIAGSAMFSDASVGTGKTVTVSGLALSGNAKGNYALTSDTFTTTADITTASSTLTATNASVAYNKTASQSVALTATVSGGSGTVNDGAVTFKVMQGSTVIGSAVTWNVVNGSASGNYTLPAGAAAGNYTIAASYAGSVGYANSVDNSHTLVVTTGINLVQGVPSLVSGNWSAGGSIVVQDQVSNSGPNTTTWFYNRYYLSSDGTTKSFSLGSRQVPALTGGGAGATSSAQTTVTIPPSAVGTFYLMACADAVTGEMVLTDNCAYASPAMKLGSLNLVQGVPSVASGTWAPGASIVVADSVTNSGPGSSTGFYVRFYLSSDGTTKSYSLGNRQVMPLAGTGGSTTSSAQTSVTIPTGIVGSWYLLACSDAVTNETSTTDNCNHSATATQLGGLNLIQGQPSVVSGNWATGGTIVVADSVSNSGPGYSVWFYNRYYLSTDGVAHNYSIGNRQVSSLAGNNVPSTAQTQVTLPTNISGSYYLVACADAVAGETATNDNCAHSATAMQLGGLNLVEAAPSVTGTPAKGGSITVVDSVSNSGPGAAGGFYVRFYLSSNGTAKSYSLGNRQVTSLAASGAGATSAGQTQLTLPPVSGGWYMLACADPVTGESSTTDNCNASAITIQ